MEQLKIQEYLGPKEDFQNIFLRYIDEECDSNDLYQNLIKLIDDQKILESPLDLKEFIRFILNLSNNHKRSPNFFKKIDQILLKYKENIKQTFSNKNIFDLFQQNKRLLYFAIENQLLTMDRSLINILKTKKYSDNHYLNYLYPLINSFLTPIARKTYERQHLKIAENFEENQKKGENETVLCQLIQNDSIDEFTTFYNNSHLTPTEKIVSSIFETNSFLLDNSPTLIEYAAFFGSLKIFKFLIVNQAKLTPSLWLYAIHGRNMEMINILLNHEIQPNDDSYAECIREAIKCHHNEIVNFLLTENNQNQSDENSDIFLPSIQFSNYIFFPKNLANSIVFYDLCRYNYAPLIALVISDPNLQINSMIIRNFHIFK